jgi:[acyl-carrier-protein] S-malonyltransferase
MVKRIGFMFAGQGAQFVGMGRDLYEQSAAAREIFETADRLYGSELSELCFAGPAERLTESRYCQPAIYTMSMACVAAFREQCGVTPVVCGGLSLGEFAALTTAGVMSFEDGIRLVSERGRLMQDACRKTAGAMAAILNAPIDQVEAICAEHDVDVANYNCPGQVVVSGEAGRLKAAVSAMTEAGIGRIIMLEVDGAFHSRLMAEAGSLFADVLAPVALAEPSCTVVQNVVGAVVTSPTEIKANLVAQVSGSVRWESCVRNMLALELDALVEFGPGKVLCGFMRRIERRFPVCNVGSAADLATAIEQLGA